MDVNFLRVGTETIHLVLRQQEGRGREQYQTTHCWVRPNLSYFFLRQIKSHSKLLNCWSHSKLKSQEWSSGWLSSQQRKCFSIHLMSDPPSACWKDLKANSAWWIEPYEQQLFWSALFDGFLLHEVKLLEEPALDQLLVGGTVLSRGSRRQDSSDRVVTNHHGVWFSLDWVL